MGGIGKTVLATWIARDLDIRKHFELVLWLTCSQTPNLQKLQQLLYLQATGKEVPDGKSTDEVDQMLSTALQGKRALLILDDCWESEHELALNHVDACAHSRTLVTTRIRGLLKEAGQVELGLPSDTDAIQILLASADLGQGMHKFPCFSYLIK